MKKLKTTLTAIEFIIVVIFLNIAAIISCNKPEQGPLSVTSQNLNLAAKAIPDVPCSQTSLPEGTC
ncbi:MAG TPA: hypothetical protein VET23_14075 [Chitinophagaceae bacterium]|nr:hypothetical protein [Chitinophagaceae bacterium]